MSNDSMDNDANINVGQMVPPPPGGMSMPVGQMTPPPGGMSMLAGQMTPPPGGMNMPVGQMTPPPGGMSMPAGQMTPPPGGMSMPVGQMIPPPGGMNMSVGQMMPGGMSMPVGQMAPPNGMYNQAGQMFIGGPAGYGMMSPAAKKPGGSFRALKHFTIIIGIVATILFMLPHLRWYLYKKHSFPTDLSHATLAIGLAALAAYICSFVKPRLKTIVFYPIVQLIAIIFIIISGSSHDIDFRDDASLWSISMIILLIGSVIMILYAFVPNKPIRILNVINLFLQAAAVFMIIMIFINSDNDLQFYAGGDGVLRTVLFADAIGCNLLQIAICKGYEDVK